MYILDHANYRVLRWPLGEPRGYLEAGGNGAGSGLNQISTSYAMFVDGQTNIYISDSANHRVTLWAVTNRTSGVLVSVIQFISAYKTFPLLGCWWKRGR